MLALWDRKVTFVSVSQFWGLALCSPFWSVSGPFVTQRLIVFTWKKKKRKKGGSRKREGPKRKEKKKDNNKPPADFKPVQWVLLVFLDATGRGGWASLFSLPLVLRVWGPGLGRTIQFPGLWPRSSVSCQAQISHSAAPSTEPETSGAHGSPLLLSLDAQCQTGQAHGSPPPLTVGAPAATGELLTKQLPAVLIKCRAFHTALLFDQSGDYPSQDPTWTDSSLLQVPPGTPVSRVLASTVPPDVYRLCVSPTLSLLPPATSST